MGDDSSMVDDFSESFFYTPEIEAPREVTKKEESPFEILPLDSIIMDLFGKIEQAQAFLAVS